MRGRARYTFSVLRFGLAMILADTDVRMDYFAGIEPVASVLRAALAQDQLETTAVTSVGSTGAALVKFQNPRQVQLMFQSEC